MHTRYLVRFDDICPTMNWTIWDTIERILDEKNIKPIVAVVPDNQDQSLMFEGPKENFWERVRSWCDKGWGIGLHGYQHIYKTQDSGMIGINSRSEFAGLPATIQKDQLEKALRIFQKENVRVDAWVAPAHSFDQVTLDILKSLGVTTISDGYYTRAVRDGEMNWIPQQIWRFEGKNTGLWTVCYHHNAWSDQCLQIFKSDIEKYQSKIISLADVLRRETIPNIKMSDRIFAKSWKYNLLAKRRLSHFLNAFGPLRQVKTMLKPSRR